MREYSFTDGNSVYKRVSKGKAKRIYNNGYAIIVCPCNLRPDSIWKPYGHFYRRDNDDVYEPIDREEQFDYKTNRFAYYNCNSESGNYLAYYVNEAVADLFERR